MAPGTRGGGGAGARGRCRDCSCSFRLEDSSFRRLGGVGRPQAAQLGPPQGGPRSAEVGRQLSRRPAALGSRDACSGPPRLRLCWGRGRGGPMTFALRRGAQRSGFPILLPHNPPTSFEQSFFPRLCWRTQESVPALVAGLVGVLRLCSPRVLCWRASACSAQLAPWSVRNIPGVSATGLPTSTLGTMCVLDLTPLQPSFLFTATLTKKDGARSGKT